MAFVKLDCGILDSTLWIDRHARELFVTALLMAQPYEVRESIKGIQVKNLEPSGVEIPPGWYGFIPAAGTGIVRRSGMDLHEGLDALERLCDIDPESRTPDFDGRRMARIDGGYLVLNFSKYRDKDHTGAERSKRYREKKMASRVKDVASRVTSRSATQAEAEADISPKGEIENIENPPPAEGEAPISLDAVKKTCGQFGATEAMAEDWWLYYDARGWIVSGVTMVKWQSSLARWANNARDKEGRDAPVKKPNPMGMKSKEDLAWEKEKREVDEFNAEQERKNKEYGIRFMANAAWARENPETRGPKPFPRWDETDMYQEVEE